MSTKTSTKWIGGIAFDAEVSGHHLIMDGTADHGGKDLGPTPKPLLLVALSGCTGMDVVSILEKMKIKNYQLRIDVDADSTTENPITYHSIRIHYHFQGQELPAEKLIKAVNLSMERYCGVHAMLHKAANILTKIYINDQEVHP